MSIFGNNIERCAEIFKALSNPHRLAVFKRLSECCPPGTACTTVEAVHQNVGELGEGLEIAPSTLSHHLKELNRAGLIQMRRSGKHVQCWVDASVLNELGSFFNKDHIDVSRGASHENS